MQFERFAIDGPALFTPRRFEDARGFFSETYRDEQFRALGETRHFVQDNHAMSRMEGTLRGLHFQTEPFAQGKLVRVTRGAIFDVAVDIRQGSPTFGRHVEATLSADNWKQLWVPAGFAHGYCTLAPDTEVIYKVTHYYSPQHERGVVWNDPDLGIEWPVAEDAAILVERDRKLPRLAELPAYFSISSTP